MMKRIAIVIAVSVLAAAGCKKPTGPQTTETAALPAPSRPVSRLMPVATPTETTTATETTAAAATPVEASRGGRPRGTPAPASARTYTLRKGDTLWSVAKKFYGDGKRWKEIAAANDIADESKLPVGKVLQIP